MKKTAVRGGGRHRTPGTTDVDRLTADLAAFRYSLRKFLRFSENAARFYGVTPQQHQLMLGVAGFTGRGSATISELAEFLQGRVHSVVGLVERAEQSGLVAAKKSKADRRVVVVSLTPRGSLILAKLSEIHHQQARKLQLFMDKNRPEEIHAGRRNSPERERQGGSANSGRILHTSESKKSA